MLQTKTLVGGEGGGEVVWFVCFLVLFCFLQSQLLNIYQLCTDEMTLVPRG